MNHHMSVPGVARPTITADFQRCGNPAGAGSIGRTRIRQQRYGQSIRRVCGPEKRADSINCVELANMRGRNPI